jgi:hypothetical protein
MEALSSLLQSPGVPYSFHHTELGGERKQVMAPMTQIVTIPNIIKHIFLKKKSICNMILGQFPEILNYVCIHVELSTFIIISLKTRFTGQISCQNSGRVCLQLRPLT